MVRDAPELEVASSDYPPKQLTRREFLFKSAVTASALLAGNLIRWTETLSTDEKRGKLNLEALEREVYPVTGKDALQASKELTGLFQHDVPMPSESNWGKSLELVRDVIDSVQTLRNYAITHIDNKEVAQSIAESLSSLSVDPFRKIENPPTSGTLWTKELFMANLQNIAKLEIFYALRNFEQRGLIDAEFLDKLQLSGWVCYFPALEQSQWYPLSERQPHRKSISSSMLHLNNVPAERNTTEYTDALVVKNWPTIMEASRKFDIDPVYIASIISMEARDNKTYNLFGGWYGKQLTLAEALQGKESPEDMSFLKKQVMNVLAFISDHEEIARKILPDSVSEDLVDYVGALLGENTSIGLGQVNLATAKRFGLVDTGDVKLNSRTPDALIAALLTNETVNIYAVASYTRKMIDELQKMQKQGLNLYLPDLSKYNPSKENQEHTLDDDPVYGPNFGIAFFGGMYTAIEYPEFNLDEKRRSHTRYELRFTPQTRNWGSWVAEYYEYYKRNLARLKLE